MSDKEVEAFLSHYGKKGMKWGVINEDKSSGKEPTAAEKKALEDGNAILQAKAETMRKKYGPSEGTGSSAPKEPRLSDQQKQLLKTVAIGAGIAGGLYLANRVATDKLKDYVVGQQLGKGVPAPMHAFWKDHLFTPHAVKLKKLSDVGVDLPAGSIIKRLSTAAEDSIKPTGCYAAFKDSDIERYKAVLPIYWKVWGHDVDRGHIVNIVAKNGVKAPSPKGTLELYNSWIAKGGQALRPNNYEDFYNFANAWADDFRSDVQSFFGHVKDNGFNALIDLNDAGGIAETPLRLLSSDGFEIGSVKKVGPAAIRKAQEAITVLEHSDLLLGRNFVDMETDPNVEAFLEHFGKKGMKWGVRRDNRANNLRAVGRGKGTTSQKLRAYSTTSPLDMVRGRGLKGGAALRGKRQIERNKRVRNGEASARDLIAYYGGTKHQDIIPSGRSAKNTKAALGASVAGVVLVSIGMNAAGKVLGGGSRGY